jgi:hypothetical protein
MNNPSSFLKTVFSNKRELGRFKRFSEKFSKQKEVESIYADLQASAPEVLAELVACAKDPSIGFPKTKQDWANTRRQYRLHWQRMEIAVQSLYNTFAKSVQPIDKV